MSEIINVPEIFGKNVFNDKAMQERLPKSVYKKLKKTIEDGAELDPSIADVVAHAMKDWAIERGATHYSHWFQPLTGITAEKHDAFISVPDSNGRVIMEFSGKELIKGEPDASSFPSGGLRSTFEARGYTTWDCTSPAFLREDTLGVTLYIPTAFCSYRGEALDKKTPLLRSMQAINEQALRILRLFGNTTSHRVIPYVGPEQEYFLVDKNKYLQRKDLIYTGRTLFGAMPPKGQEMDDHYFGSIRPRVGAFMKELNETLWRLGVSAKTQHNEVAPAQHELAPTYCQVNLAVDHNQMVMEAMKRVAGHHGLTCLLHEKPFDGINGSGKHNNWSLTSDDGINMMNPGETPHENVQFLLVLACIMKAVDRHADLLRESTAIPGNDHRLGAAEAPPAIISIFLGEQLEDVVAQLVETGKADNLKEGGVLRTGVSTLPDFVKDATDRNRTSPFAFTGNRFEFRAVGSSANCASAMIALNAAVAYQLQDFKKKVDALIANGKEKTQAILSVVKDLITESKDICFDGNGYSEEWKEEAKRRGLDCETSVPLIFDSYLKDDVVKMFEQTHVFTQVELQARNEVKWEIYTKKIQIEARVLGDLAINHIVPVATRYQSLLLDNVFKIKSLFPAEKSELIATQDMEVIEKIAFHLLTIKEKVHAMVEARKVANKIENEREKAIAYHDTVAPQLDDIRYHIDKLELMVDNEMWPLPKYRELLFIR